MSTLVRRSEIEEWITCLDEENPFLIVREEILDFITLQYPTYFTAPDVAGETIQRHSEDKVLRKFPIQAFQLSSFV